MTEEILLFSSWGDKMTLKMVMIGCTVYQFKCYCLNYEKKETSWNNREASIHIGSYTDAYSELSKTSNMEFFVKIVEIF